MLVSIIFSLLLGYGAFRYGAVLAEDWAILVAGVGILAALDAVFAWRHPVKPDRLACVFAGVLLVAAAVQLVPLPVGLLQTLSPSAADIHLGLSAIGAPPERATLSITPSETTGLFLKLAGCLTALFLARRLTLRLRNRAWWLVVPIVSVAAGEAVLGLVQYALGGPDSVTRGTYINRNHFAGLLELALPLPLMGAVWVYRRHRTKYETPASSAVAACALLGLAGIILLGILLSLSRMGFLAALGSLFVTGAITLSTAFVPQGGKSRPGLRWIPAGGVAAAVFLGFIFLPTDQLIARFAAVASTEEVSAETRAELWRESAPLIAASPVFGFGLGGYESAFMRYKHVAPMQRADFAHNDYLQLLIELGLLGFVPGFALAALAHAGALNAAAAPATASERYLGIGCSASLIALTLHSFVDFNLYIPANALAVSWIAGIALALRFYRPNTLTWR